MAQKFRLKKAEEIRRTSVMIQQKKIKQMYEQLYDDINHEIEQKGERMSNVYLQKLSDDIEARIVELNEKISQEIVENATTVCEQTVEGKRIVMAKMGFREYHYKRAFMYVPKEVVTNIANGNVYQDGWTLSKSIWGHNKQVQYNINRILANDAAVGKSAYDTAKDVEKYVNPSARKRSRAIEFQKYKIDASGHILKDENGNPVIDKSYGKGKFYFGNVDYNAQRLARTLIGHAYQQSFEVVNEYDPFVTGYIWIASGIHGRMCKVCEDRDGQFFKKGELPLDHPNGMCTFEAYMPDGLDGIMSKLDAWYKAPVGTYPEIDRYAIEFLK